MAIHRRDLLRLALASPALVAAPGCGSDAVSIDERLPVGPFGADSTAEEVTAGLDLTGRTALVTGCNSGIGSFTDFGLVNGIEKIFVVNYLGHVVLTPHLLPWYRPRMPAGSSTSPARWLT